jgi:hypothetical protein
MSFLYGGTGSVSVKATSGGGCCVQLPIETHQFVPEVKLLNFCFRDDWTGSLHRGVEPRSND